VVFDERQLAFISHPPYSPDFAPSDFFLFPKMKLKLKGVWFDSIEEIQAESQKVLDTLTQKDFQEAFQKWRRRCYQCLYGRGDYLEGDGGQ
jgi:predicted acetyltransferase